MLKNKLDSEAVYKLDEQNVYESILRLSEQIEVTWNEMVALELPVDFCREVNRVVLIGMGGSALGGKVIKAWAEDKLLVPFEIVNDYNLPAHVDGKTLVILSSYSGNTEEVLSVAEELNQRQAYVFTLSGGGRLEEMAIKSGWPMYVYKTEVNPSKQPRMGVGFGVTGVLALLVKLDLVRVEENILEKAIHGLKEQIKQWGKEIETKNNAAKQMAEKIVGNGVALISARHIVGATHVMSNQLNENAKTWSVDFVLPELNHHLLEGLQFPTGLKKQMLFILVTSDKYDTKIRTRLDLTQEVIEKQGYKTTKLMPEATEELAQVYELIGFSSFMTYYLALLNGVKPADIPWVDYFKQKLAGND